MSDRDHYVLHVGAHPSSHHLQKEKTKHPPKFHTKQRNSAWAWIWDKVHFVLVSGAVFLMIYTLLNWQALYINAQYYWETWRGAERPLERLVEETPVANEPERIVTVEGGAQHGELPVPPLQLEVVPPDTRLVVPRINQNVPVIGVRNENLIARQWEALEQDIQSALRSGVIHYPGTALPGDGGNVVLTGHSSYYAWDPGRFKDVFALLHDVQLGDRVVLFFNQKKYTYEVDSRVIVLPQQVDVLAATDHEQLTLITCTPIGTNLKRLVLTARLVEVQ